MPTSPIIVVDDEPDALLAMQTALMSFSYRHVLTCNGARELFQKIEKHGAQLVLLDLLMPEMSGEEALERLSLTCPDIPVIVTTGINELDTAVRCMQHGAKEYLVKPIERDRLRVSIQNTLRIRELERCNEAFSATLLNEELAEPEIFSSIVTQDPSFLTIFRYIEAVAPSSQSILITGDTGTGKELIARAIHKASGCTGEFVPVNVAGLDDNMLSDTLFGHVKGAFTGAELSRKGLVELASEGTLFLDEIGDMSTSSQVKLLRLIQENSYYPIGSDKSKVSLARVVAATSLPVQALQNGERFRKDLYYRLRTHHLHLRPLEERKEDIPLLVREFLRQAAKELDRPVPTPPKELYSLLSTWHFPGNVRELRAMIYDAVADHRGHVLSLASVRNALGMTTEQKKTKVVPLDAENPLLLFGEQLPTFKQAETLLLDEALRRSGGNRSIAAGMLGVTRQAITQRLRKSKPSKTE